MRLFSKVYYSLFLVILWTGGIFAQNNQLRNYTVEDGLPQSQVYDIVQDEIGYLWLGTQGGGLSRFDGETFITWKEEDGLGSNYIQALAAQKDTVYIGTRRGLSIKVQAQFLNIAAPSIYDILVVQHERYLATQYGVYHYTKNGLQKLNLHPAIDEQQINDLYFDGDWYWIATADALWKLRSLTQQPQTVRPYETSNFISVTQYKDNIFAATFDAGIIIIDPETPNTTDKIITQPTRVNHITLLHENELWVATDNGGITIFDAASRQVIQKIGQPQGLTVSHVRKTFSDQQGNVWIATSGGGLFKYFQNNFKHYDRDTGLKGNRIYAVHSIGNEVWFSSAEKGLTRIDTAGIHHIPQIDDFSDVKIKTLASDLKGNLWTGSDGKGIRYRYKTVIDSFAVSGNTVADLKIDTLKKEVFKDRLITVKDGLPSDWIRKIVMVGNTAWVATYSDGIVTLQYNNEKKKDVRIVKHYGAKNGIEDLLITDMVIDDVGRIWYATQKGHLGYIQQKKVIHLGQVLPVDVKINSLLFHKDYLFIGTAGNGIWWSDKEAQTAFKKLGGQKALYSNTIYQLIFDDQEALWVGTESGVDKIILNQEQEIIDVFHFGRNEGFLGIETCLNAVTKDANGNLWFGAIYGLTSYENFETAEVITKPSLYFEGVEIAYQEIDTLNFERWNQAITALQLQSTQRQISLNYKTVDIDHPEAVQYRYKLNDEIWSPWTREAKQNFSGLAYGAHHFMAQSRNYRWVESDPISLYFFIEIPLHQKAWFQWTGIVLLVLLMSFFSWRYIQSIKRRNSKQRRQLELENHLLSLEQKALRLQMNPHFIFNALNGIKAMGTQDPAKMENTVNTFATLLRETLYNSREDTITLAQEIKTITHYIEVEQLMARDPFTFTVNPPETMDPEEILIPPMLIQPFVENAIRHGILKNQKEGILTITFAVKEAFLECSIRDNGIGIFQSQKNKTPTDHQSMALTVTRERIESLTGKDTLQIREIKDKGIIAGTEICFKIPLQTDY